MLIPKNCLLNLIVRISLNIIIVTLLVSSTLSPIFTISNQSTEIFNLNTNHIDDIVSFNLNNNLLNPIAEASEFNGDFIDIVDYGDSFEGLNIFIVANISYVHAPIHFHLLVTDMKGSIISQIYLGTNFDTSYYTAKFINTTTVIVEGLNYPFLWNFFDNSTYYLNFLTHHDITFNPVHNSFFALEQKNVTVGDTPYIFDVIKEYSMDGDLLWELSSEDFVSPTDGCHYTHYIELTEYVTHANTVFFDPDDNMLYVHMRNLNTFYKISYSSKEVQWSIGQHGDFNLYDKNGDLKQNLFYHAHGLEKVDENTFILFDNDLHNQSLPEDEYHSRIIEISIDEGKKIANVTWSWLPPFGYSSRIWGDADRLPNGNRLGTFGQIISFENQTKSRITELTPEGEIAWEMKMISSLMSNLFLYCTDRFLLSPYLSLAENTIQYVGNNVTIEWETAYNFKTVQNKTGFYKLFLDETMIDSGILNFNKYWRATNHSTQLGKLSVGCHNFTIEVIDDAGHSTIKQMNITITPFYIDRSGPENIEKNQDNTIVQWTGETITPLMMNITINGTLNSSRTWNGELIELDLNSLVIGKHSISLVLINNSIVIYNDTFWSNVYLLEAPQILDSPVNQIIEWGDECLLSWIIQDSTPYKWEIYVNNSIYLTELWLSQYYELEWEFPFLDEGVYNCTLVIYDYANQTSSDSFWLTIIPPSPPIISEYPAQTNFQYGVDILRLSWEVHGGVNYTLYVDELKSYEGLVINNIILIEESNWNLAIWRPGEHNLSLEVSDAFGKITTGSILIFIWLNLGDPYVDAYLPNFSDLYYSGENAIGAPDGEYTNLVLGYTNGYITLDMGFQEEIIDKAGKDFTVVAGSGTYSVWISNDPLIPFVFLDSGSGTQGFDLATSAFDQVRYLRIEYVSGVIVELDAIVALHYNEPEWDNEPPMIISPGDFWVWDDQLEVTVRWNVSDQLPNNYSIFVNGDLFFSSDWNGSDIISSIPISGLSELNVTLVVFDLMLLKAEDTIRIEVREKSNIGRILQLVLIPTCSVLAAAGITWTTVRFLKKKKIK
jgi:hypothetical protein